MNKKWSIELVDNYMKSLGYILISNEYKNTSTKLVFKDEDGYLYYQSLSMFINGGRSKFDKSNPYTIDNIKLWCKLNNKSFELLEGQKYNGAIKKLNWKCLNCKETFTMNWNNIYSGQSCGVCAGLQVVLSNCLATKNPELAKEWHPTLNGELTPYNVIPNRNKKVWWKCDEGHEWEAIISSRNNGCGCPYCSGRYPTKENNLLIINSELCKEWNYNKNKKKPENYLPNSNDKVWWKCRECGHEWKSTINNRNNGTGCPQCNESKGEKRIKEYLSDNINYIWQKEFDGLIGLGNGLLSYDFYLIDYNILIEYQGLQHEKYKPGFHKSEKDFEYQQEHDRRKKEYAQNNNINLLEIWYWDYDNVEKILDEYLFDLKEVSNL
ncbi:MAG: zinc-ribbon domain-containing protein [Bacilli bacterium]